MMAHCVAPQQSFMMATLLLVMDGLFGGGSGVCFFTFGGPEGEYTRKHDYSHMSKGCRQ